MQNLILPFKVERRVNTLKFNRVWILEEKKFGIVKARANIESSYRLMYNPYVVKNDSFKPSDVTLT